MSFSATVLNVMIASPGDVLEERAIVTEEIHRWNDANATARKLVLIPVKWETHSTPQMGAHPQKIVNQQLLEEADILVGVFGTRIGTPTEDYVSGSVEEVRTHVAAGKTAKIYFSDVPVRPSSVNPDQYASVRRFRDECQSSGLYATYNSLEQFRRDFAHHLAIELNHPRYLWLKVDEQAVNEEEARLSPEALSLLKAAATSRDGVIILQEALDGTWLHAGGKQFMEGSPRSVAKWRASLNETLAVGAVEQVSKEIHRITALGYELAEKGEAIAREAAFEDQRKSHFKEIIESLGYIQRDFIRLMLIKGPSVWGTVIGKAIANQVAPLDWNSMTQPLLTNGLMTQSEDRMHGHSTYTLNTSVEATLRILLFPREELSEPFFKGI